jgi:hypothetical protein
MAATIGDVTCKSSIPFQTFHDYVGDKLLLSTIDELIMQSIATYLATNCSKIPLESFRCFYTQFIQTLQEDYAGGKLLLGTIVELIM